MRTLLMPFQLAGNAKGGLAMLAGIAVSAAPPNPCAPPSCWRELIDLNCGAIRYHLGNQLCNAITDCDIVWSSPIVDEKNSHLTAVIGIDHASTNAEIVFQC